MDWLKRLKKRFLTVSAIALGLVPAAAHATWIADTSVNTHLVERGGSQDDPFTIPDGQGGIILIWIHGPSDDVMAQRISKDGVPLWQPDGVLVASSSVDQSAPRAVSDNAGGAIITWYDGEGALNFDVHAQRVSATGTLLWGPAGVPISDLPGSMQGYPVITRDGAGGAIIAWNDGRAGAGTVDIYAQRIDSSGTPLWTADGVPVCIHPALQATPTLASDGSGGAIIAWTDHRNLTMDIYAQRISFTGVPQWVANGVPVCSASGAQQYPVIASDGAGGAFVGWMDSRADAGDVFAQRMSGTGVAQWASNGVAVCWAAGAQSGISMMADYGTPVIMWTDERNGSSNKDIYVQRLTTAGASMWTANGVGVCTAPGEQSSPNSPAQPMVVVASGGGAIVVWNDFRNDPDGDIYTQKLYSGGSTAWAANGVAVTTALKYQINPAAITDGYDGVIVVWEDYRGYDLFGQLVRTYGDTGSPPPPVITGVSDVPFDQGGKVQIEWSGSSLDSDPAFGIASYSVWRRVPSAPSAAAFASGRARVQTAGAGGQATYWEYLTMLPARGFTGYSYVAETTSDSLGAANPKTSFMVLAEETGGTPFYASGPDSGYSVDNLSPSSPWPVGGQYMAGSVRLHWSPNREDDFAGYRVYEGASANFDTDASCLLSSTTDTTCVDMGPPGSYYKLTAVDVHGNESPATLLSPAQISAAEEVESPGQIRFGAPWPNPSGGSVAFRVTLPRDSDVRVTVYDVQGRTVKEVAAERAAAGYRVYRWDGRQTQGVDCAAGVYFARLEVDGKVSGTRRLTIVR